MTGQQKLYKIKVSDNVGVVGNMKNRKILLISALLAVSLLAGCNEEEKKSASEGTVQENNMEADVTEDNKEEVAVPSTEASDEIVEEIKNEIDLSDTVSFSSETAFGDKMDSSVFADYDLTMINIWGTFCHPCISEMPDIQKLYEEMEPQGVNVIGFVANGEPERVERAQNILTELKITYPNLVFSDELSGAISAQIMGYPTTVFVDSEGKIVGEPVLGSQTYEMYMEHIQDRLKSIK